MLLLAGLVLGLALSVSALCAPAPSWQTLGVSAPIYRRLAELGLREPLEVQALAWPVITSGQDAVVLSEAGSGKTLAYLAPLMHMLLETTARQPARRSRAVIAVPSADLAAQVLRVARSLANGLPLVCAPAASAGAPHSDECADVIVGTVPECLPFVVHARRPRDADGSAPRRPPPITRLVVDEADLLLAGLNRKGRASTSQPVMQMLEAVLAPRGRGANGAQEAAAGGKKTPPRTDHPHQLILATATLPGQGSASVGTLVSELFPSVAWVRSAGAHRPIGRLASSFHSVSSEAEREAALLGLALSPPNRTLVFVNSASRADAVARRLRDAGEASARSFHPGLASKERAFAVEAFNKNARGVLVCSGLGARGLDFAPVGLVVQHQLAPHMVEYMHRVGRTARAGRPGAAVAFVSEGSEAEAALVKEVQRCVRGSWKYV